MPLHCNIEGSEKLWPLVMCQFQNLYCMKTIKNSPSEYKAGQNAWIAAKVFHQWLLHLGRRMLCKNRNILLLLDQCAPHSYEGLQLETCACPTIPQDTFALWIEASSIVWNVHTSSAWCKIEVFTVVCIQVVVSWIVYHNTIWCDKLEDLNQKCLVHYY